MSVDSWRWLQKAQQLRFEQLEIARKQAESWRTGLTGITALLAAVLVVKGRDSVSDLAQPYKWVVPLLLALALATLVWATLTAVSAASGSPSRKTLLTGEDLRDWTVGEVRRIEKAVVRARVLTVAGVTAVAAAVGVSWLAPVATPPAALVVVESASGRICGTLVDTSGGNLLVKVREDQQVVPLAGVARIRGVTACPR
ncbi:hypothetical protein E1286_12860 [Nonomuraea terrae]|uniref:Uncharacterized protein n=1 Tax=Nonomuraea terrae TaxID=2530383 RepID=A0A4R4YX23_9ACTN|nr:hypothetical protein [Nonomuraea terrae]TDD50021.1 hypothetical protein E1286_12860 [Nonomuraea terrae]